MNKIITALLAATLGTSAIASTGTLTFRGAINDKCALSGFTDGVIVVTASGNTFSSAEAGGSAARVAVETNAGNFRLVYGQPTLTGSAGTVSNVTFSIASSATGTNNGGQNIAPISATGSTLPLSAPGAYNVTVNATASLSNGQEFPSGTYTLQIPVSCTK